MIGVKGMNGFIVILIFFVALIPARAEEVTLLPLSATYAVDMSGQNSTSLVFPVPAGDGLMINIQPANSLELSLVTADGRTITPANAVDNGADFSNLQPSTPYEKLFAAFDVMTMSLDAPPEGVYTLNIVRGAETNSVFNVQVTTTGTGLRMGMVLGANIVQTPANVPVSVAVMLFEGDAPLTGAVADVFVRDALGQSVTSLIARDDGIAPDARANDGAYTASFTPPNPGEYYLRGFVRGNTSNSVPFEASLNARLHALTENIIVTGEYRESTGDEDADGFIDYVDLIFTYTGELRLNDGTYFADVVLRAANGNTVDEVGRLNVAGDNLSVRFTAEQLKSLGVDGPYTISLLLVRQGENLVARFKDLGATQAWQLAQLERPNTVLHPVHDDFGWDGNADGLIDWFRVSFIADTLLPGYYGVSADIRSPNGTLLDSSGIAAIYLQKQNNPVDVWFYGPAIAAGAEDGPYHLTNVLVYPHFRARATARVPDLGTTREYRCQEFTGCAADVNTLFEILLSKIDELEINQGIKQSLRAKVANAKRAYEREQLKTARNQLSAFVHELQAQAAKHLETLIAEDLEKLAVSIVNELAD